LDTLRASQAGKVDPIALRNKQAAEGKVKRGRFAGWFQKRSWLGTTAIDYRDLLVSYRQGGLWGVGVAAAMAAMLVVGVYLLPLGATTKSGHKVVPEVVVWILALIATTITTMATLTPQTYNKVIEIVKPLPFSAENLMRHCVYGKLKFSITITLVTATLFLPAGWSMRQWYLPILVTVPSAYIFAGGSSVLISYLFPQKDDLAQTQIRGLIGLGVAAAYISLLIGSTFATVALGISPLWLFVPLAGVAVAVGEFFLRMGTRLFEEYNPSD
jgi:hypothetical protein